MLYITNVAFRVIWGSAVIALFPLLPGHAQNLLLNGDFEAGPHVGNIITDWVVTGAGHAHAAMEGATSGDRSAALSIGADSEGTLLSQSFPTSIGQTYVAEFDAGIFGVRSGSPLQLNVQVLGTENLLDRAITPPEAFTFTAGDVVFHRYRFLFTADSAATTLRFTDIGLGNASADIVIDTVSVVPTILPLPTTLPLENGDFESGPFNLNGTVSGWTVTGASRLALLAEGATSGSYSAAFGPGGDFQDDILSQRFFTTPGQLYAVNFDAAVFGITASTQRLRVRALGAGDLFDHTLTPPYFGTYDPGAIQFQHYRFLFVANSSVTTLEFSNVGTGNLDADVVLDSVSAAPTPPPSFAAWQAAHFDSEQLNDPQISSWEADPDHDQIANGLEFFFNTDPLAGITLADANALPRIAIEVSGSSRYLTYTFPRLIGWAGNAAVVGVSDDLIVWDESGNQIELVNVTASSDGITEIVKVRLNTPIDEGPVPRKFLRLGLDQ